MNWYVAKIVFCIRIENSSHCAQFEEQWRLIHAVDASTAFQKANEIGQKGEESFLNTKNNRVSWEFIAVSDLKVFTSLADGMELHSQVIEADHENHYITHARDKSVELSGEYFSAQAIN